MVSIGKDSCKITILLPLTGWGNVFRFLTFAGSLYRLKVTNTVTGATRTQWNRYTIDYNTAISGWGIGNPSVEQFKIEYLFASASRLIDFRNYWWTTIPAESDYEIYKFIRDKCQNITGIWYATSFYSIIPTEIEFKNKKKLTFFTNGNGGEVPYASFRGITKLDLSGCDELNSVIVSNNYQSPIKNTLTTLNLQGSNKIETLTFGGYLLGAISLDLTGKTSLKYFRSYFDKITSITFDSHPVLQDVIIYQATGLASGSRLETLNISTFAGNPAFKNFNIGGLGTNQTTYIKRPSKDIIGWNLMADIDSLIISPRTNGATQSTPNTYVDEPDINLSNGGNFNPKYLTISHANIINPTYSPNVYPRLVDLYMTNLGLGFIQHFKYNFRCVSTAVRTIDLQQNDMGGQDFNLFDCFLNFANNCNILIGRNNLSFDDVGSFLNYAVQSGKTNISLSFGNVTGFTGTGKYDFNAPVVELLPNGIRPLDLKNTLTSRGWVFPVSTQPTNEYITFFRSTLAMTINTLVNTGGLGVVLQGGVAVSSVAIAAAGTLNVSSLAGGSEIKLYYKNGIGGTINTITGVEEIEYRVFGNTGTQCFFRNSPTLKKVILGIYSATASTNNYNMYPFDLSNNPLLTTLVFNGQDMSTTVGTGYFILQGASYNLSGCALSSQTIENFCDKILNRTGTWTANATINVSGGTNGIPSISYKNRLAAKGITLITN